MRTLATVSGAVLLLVVLAAADTRHSATVHRFERLTNYPHGRANYVADHELPLCLGGADSIDNLVWQPTLESYAKDIIERRMCAAAKRQGYRLTKVTP